jgi:hypothetical protein
MTTRPLAGNMSQFTLRALFLAVAMFAMVFAAVRFGGWGATIVLLTFGSLIVAHVVGNALGTRLRDEVSPQLNPKPIDSAVPIVAARPVRIDHRLHERTRVGRIILATSGGAAVIGALLGGMALAFWTGASLSGWLVGTLSSAVLGAFFGFLLASFLQITIRAWWQAAKR